MLSKITPTLLSIIIIITSLHLLRELLIPLALAILLVYLTEPLNRMLVRVKVPGIFRVPSILGITTLGVLGLSRLVTHNLIALGQSLPLYEERLDVLLSDLLNWIGLDRSELQFLKGDQSWFTYLQPQTLTSMLGSGFVQTLVEQTCGFFSESRPSFAVWNAAHGALNGDEVKERQEIEIAKKEVGDAVEVQFGVDRTSAQERKSTDEQIDCQSQEHGSEAMKKFMFVGPKDHEGEG